MGEQMSFKAWLVQHKVPQREIANLLGVSLAIVNAKLNGRSDFTLSQIKTICNKYNLSADIFLI